MESLLRGVLPGTDDNHDEAMVVRLKRAWRNERCAPEVLSYAQEVVEAIQHQVEEKQASLVDVDVADPAQGFLVNLHRMEVDRLMFLLRSYLRTRLAKIDLHVLHILSTPSMLQRLSPSEITYAKGYLDLVEGHFNDSFLNALPEKLRSLTEQNAEVNMISEGDLSTFVFCRVLEDVGEFVLDEQGGETVSLEKGDTYLVRYHSLRGLLKEGKVELV